MKASVGRTMADIGGELEVDLDRRDFASQPEDDIESMPFVGAKSERRWRLLIISSVNC
ncbi:hypothetical protein OAS67_08405 [Alphaproteobacteria bacterium]|nr:hypothetical protein [Alphaproteobacteria bacterium]